MTEEVIMRVRVLSTTVLLVGTAVFVGSSPAGAATLTAVGTELTVTSSTNEEIRFSCGSGGTTRVNGTASSPAIACSALTKVTVTSVNSTQQTVNGSGLNHASFTAGPTLTANTGGGDDKVTETDRADTINLGGDDDELVLRLPTSGNVSLDLGNGTLDEVDVLGTSGDDTVAATSTSSGATIAISSTGGATSYTVLNAEQLTLNGGDGDDTVRSTGVTAASSIVTANLFGSDGDDVLRAGVIGGQMHGGTGTNQFVGSSGLDRIYTSSATDSIDGGTGANQVFDTSSLRSGGRTLAAGTGTDWWYFGQYPGDSVARIRPSKGIVASLTRPGIQGGLGSYDLVEVALNNNTEPQSKSIVDVIATGHAVSAIGSNGPHELLDVTIPTGSWTTDGFGTTFTIDPTAPGYGNIASINMGQTRIHGTWANTQESYAHRVIRDLMFRFATDAQRDQLEAQLIAGTKTPASTVAGLMNTDEYRGLDVDRVFVKYLRRTPDPGGRTYWINSLRNGKALWRFRAQLFGSPEYFTKAGGTNATYVTRAYNDVLGRNPDPSGQTYWTNKLNNGADRGSVALQFMNSAEARRRLVDDQYLRFEEHLPTQAEQDFWVAKLPTDTGELQLIAALASGDEYYEFD